MSWQPFSWNQIRWQPYVQPALDRTAETSHEALRLAAAFLTPAALVAGVLGVWRLGADLGWTDQFFIGSGILSHWQIWVAMAGFLQTASVFLNRRLQSVARARRRF